MRVILLNRASKASAWFDFLRWFAAFYVVAFHLRPVLYVGSSVLAPTAFTAKVIYGATSVGYQFVMLFFVLSGFLIGSSVLKKMIDGSWSWRSYLSQRLTRLWVVLIPALLLTWLWASLEVHLFHDQTYFNSSMSWSTVVGNILFLQGLFVSNFGQNLPLWSLTYEFWYYILFPCILLVFFSKRKMLRFVYAILAVLLVIGLGKDISLYFIVWLLGVLLSILPPPKLFSRRLIHMELFASILMVTMLLVYGKHYITDHHVANFDMVRSFPIDMAVSLGFSVLLYMILHGFNGVAINSKFVGISSHLAGFSYTLYLTHYPIVNFLRRWLGNGTWGTWYPDAANYGRGAVILGAIIIYAWALARLTESHTPRLRNLLRGVVSTGARSHSVVVVTDES